MWSLNNIEYEKCKECLNRYVLEGVQMCFENDDMLKNCNVTECEDMRYLED